MKHKNTMIHIHLRMNLFQIQIVRWEDYLWRKSSYAVQEHAITQSRLLQADKTSPGLMSSVKQDISNRGFTLDGLGNNKIPYTPALLARDIRDLPARGGPLVLICRFAVIILDLRFNDCITWLTKD